MFILPLVMGTAVKTTFYLLTPQTVIQFGQIVKIRMAIFGAVDKLVQFLAVKPKSTAFWAIVDLNALSTGHIQFDCTEWTLHALKPP
jgi:hypothetical protein